MSPIRRVTLRCLCEDLTTDWDDVDQQRTFSELRNLIADTTYKDGEIAKVAKRLPTTSRAEHPLVRNFYSVFADIDSPLQRSSISGLSSPRWWKLKVSHWRGAATDADRVGEDEVWLCAGGLRAKGNRDDFYKAFEGRIGLRGPEAYLPAVEDRRFQRIEEKLAQLQAWKEQIRLAVLVSLARCQHGTEESLHIPKPGAHAAEPLAHVKVTKWTAGSGEESLSEVIIHVHPEDPSRANLLQQLITELRAVIEPNTDHWDLRPGPGQDQMWAALLPPKTLDAASAALSTGTLPAASKSNELLTGVTAHYTQKNQLVGAYIDGDAVRGLCGQWFVPTRDPENLEICRTCQEHRESLPVEQLPPPPEDS